jgi:ABC-2 type transport system permease protein
VEESLVMDPQNEPFPIPITRQVGDFQVQEIQALDYPFFVDIRPDGMDPESPIVANLPAVTMNWTSPLTVDQEKSAQRDVITLLQSSPNSWLRTSTDIQPNLELYPDLGFAREGEGESYPLAVSVQGVFESYFQDKPPPSEEGGEAEEGSDGGPRAGTIEVSPDSARLVVVGSAEFLDDIVFDISASLTRDRYLNSLQLVQNAVDWCVEDLDLLTIRSRGTASRVLRPAVESQQSFWEGLNYVVALLALVGIGVVWNVQRRNEQPMELVPPGTAAAPGTVPVEEEE